MPATLSSTKTRAALRTSARVSLQMLLVLLLTAVAVWLLGRMWSVSGVVVACDQNHDWPKPGYGAGTGEARPGGVGGTGVPADGSRHDRAVAVPVVASATATGGQRIHSCAMAAGRR